VPVRDRRWPAARPRRSSMRCPLCQRGAWAWGGNKREATIQFNRIGATADERRVRWLVFHRGVTSFGTEARIDLIESVLRAELARGTFWGDPRALYRVKAMRRLDTEMRNVQTWHLASIAALRRNVGKCGMNGYRAEDRSGRFVTHLTRTMLADWRTARTAATAAVPDRIGLVLSHRGTRPRAPSRLTANDHPSQSIFQKFAGVLTKHSWRLRLSTLPCSIRNHPTSNSFRHNANKRWLRQRVFAERRRRMAGLLASKMHFIDAVDITNNAARSSGLVDDVGNDAVQCVLTITPRFSIFLSTSSNSGASMSAIGREPIWGKISASSRATSSARYLGASLLRCFSSHSRATASNVFSHASFGSLTSCLLSYVSVHASGEQSSRIFSAPSYSTEYGRAISFWASREPRWENCMTLA